MFCVKLTGAVLNKLRTVNNGYMINAGLINSRDMLCVIGAIFR